MYFESDASSSKPRRSTRGNKNENENKIIPQSQSGQLKLSKSKTLVPGTYDEDDDDVVVIEKSPSPAKKPQKSILGRRPKNLVVSDISIDDVFNFDVSGPSSALRAKNQTMKEPARRRPIVKKIQPEQTAVDVSLNRSEVQKKSTSTVIIDSDSDDDFFGSQSRASTSKASKVASPPKKAQKRQIETESDDIFNFEAPKRIRQSNSTVSSLSRTLKSQSISSQLEESVGTKRGADTSADDLFSFGPKRSKIGEPKLRRNLRKEAEKAAEVSDSVIEISDTLVSTSDLQLDLEPGHEIGDGEWLSKDSFGVKKKSSDDTEQSSSGFSEETESKQFFNVIPVSINLDESHEVRGKSFKKKSNFMKQTNTIDFQQLELHDCNLLYPTVKYDD